MPVRGASGGIVVLRKDARRLFWANVLFHTLLKTVEMDGDSCLLRFIVEGKVVRELYFERTWRLANKNRIGSG